MGNPFQKQEEIPESIMELIRSYLNNDQFIKAFNKACEIKQGFGHSDEIVNLFKKYNQKDSTCAGCKQPDGYLFNFLRLKWEKQICDSCEKNAVVERLKSGVSYFLSVRNVPKRFCGSDITDFPNKYRDLHRETEGLFIFGERGVGKTHFVAAIIKDIILNSPITKNDGGPYGLPPENNMPLFISVPEFFL